MSQVLVATRKVRERHRKRRHGSTSRPKARFRFEERHYRLHVACDLGDLVEALAAIEQGADVNDVDRHRTSPLLRASSKNHVKVARLLLDRGADVDQPDSRGWTPLCAASRLGHVEVARLLVERNADIDRPTVDGYTPIFMACSNLHNDVARLLVARGAQVNRAARGGATPCEIACRHPSTRLLEILLAYRRDIRYDAMANKSSVLFIVHMRGFLKGLPWLPYVDIESATSSEDWALMQVARRHGSPDHAKLLLAERSLLY
ncbi:hypothetical protein CTAYLR_000887 [Chrysophaeum taylorii]|uniref:Uncharacterized protein n=1 Tax=Chrysophaeum taylorii TaxID=2483200 RepID=A0AAD7UH02_9STRA|nr:hypothetical protein CTAYLR_000887 [Chrysophaeum taylorii]